MDRATHNEIVSFIWGIAAAGIIEQTADLCASSGRVFCSTSKFALRASKTARLCNGVIFLAKTT